MDSSIYDIISEQKAPGGDKELRINIRKRILKHVADFPEDTRHYLRPKLNKNEADPVGYFYLLYKIDLFLEKKTLIWGSKCFLVLLSNNFVGLSSKASTDSYCLFGAKPSF